jgi:hypothetical protein
VRAVLGKHKIARRSHLVKPPQSGLHDLRDLDDRCYSQFGRLVLGVARGFLAVTTGCRRNVGAAIVEVVCDHGQTQQDPLLGLLVIASIAWRLARSCRVRVTPTVASTAASASAKDMPGVMLAATRLLLT